MAHEDESLREWLIDSKMLHLVSCKVTGSGMQRYLVVMVSPPHHHPVNVSWQVAQVAGFRTTRDHQQLIISACGVDVGLIVARDLSNALYGNPEAIRHRWI